MAISLSDIDALLSRARARRAAVATMLPARVRNEHPTDYAVRCLVAGGGEALVQERALDAEIEALTDLRAGLRALEEATRTMTTSTVGALRAAE